MPEIVTAAETDAAARCEDCSSEVESVCERCDRCGVCCDCAHCENRRCRDPIVESVCDRCDRCESCCECAHCEYSRCRNPIVESTCSRCERCANCCNCAYCEGCNDSVESVCGRCDLCEGCCECALRGVELVTRKPHFHQASRAEHKQNPSARFIAAEIEVASIDGRGHLVEDAVEKWSGSIVEDGSLPASGFEINTSPASGDKFVEQIEEICTALRSASAQVTIACGLHVHIDARDFSYYDIRRLVHVYAAIEETLFAMVSPSRRRSIYCKPCGKDLRAAIERGRLPHKAVKKAIAKGVYGEESGSAYKLRRHKYCEARYAALNLHSWFYRGTVECRLFGGTVEAHKILCWGRLWAQILDYTASHTDEEIETTLAGTPRECLDKIVSGDKALEMFIAERIACFADSL